VCGVAYGQQPALDSINGYIAAEMKRQRIPGLSMAILRGDQVLLARGYGYSNLELRVPSVTSWTVLRCETLARRGITWLAASIRRVCYLRAASPTDHIVVSVFYDGDWQAAYLDISRY
jgi:hypothetical protein